MIAPTATDTLLDELIRADRALGLAFERTVGLSRSRLELLCAIARSPGEVTQAELRRTLDVDAAVITRQLVHLEGAGLVGRRTHRSDRRSVAVELTEAGRERHDTLVARRREFEAWLRAEFGDGRIEDLRDGLRQLRARIEACSSHGPGSRPGRGRSEGDVHRHGEARRA